jgi:hypothetical protein
MLKISNNSENSDKNRKHSKALLFGLYMFDKVQKTRTKKSHASVPLKG